MTNTQPKYEESFKKNIVALHQNGKTQTELSKEYGISTSAISHWIKLYTEVKVDDNTIMTAKQPRRKKKSLRICNSTVTKGFNKLHNCIST